MALLSPQEEQVLRQHLSTLDKPVSLLLFTQTIGGTESGTVARQVLDEVARLSDKITLVERNFVLDTQDRERYAVNKSPAIVVLRDGEFTRMRFYGAPTGYEFVPLVEAIVLAGSGKLELQEETLEMLAKVDSPLHLEVFTTPT
jgi:alkyl hydroperoxide reductase subunit AhpF